VIQRLSGSGLQLSGSELEPPPNPAGSAPPMALWQRVEQRQADLIRTLGLDPSTVTKMLQRLEQSGFVTRKPSTVDRRTVMGSATRAGQALRNQVEQLWRRLEGVTTAGLTDEDRDADMRLPERMESNLTGEPGHTGPTGPA
jgi:DNA-binding MarR family transcriptional regulator